MYKFIEDIKFVEQIKELGFNNTYTIVLVKDKCFYCKDSKYSKLGIYKYFRSDNMICGRIFKPTASEKDIKYIDIKGKYSIHCKDTMNRYKYYCVAL